MRTVLELLKDIHDDYDFESSTDFISDGLLDSFDLTVIIILINSEYNIELKANDCMPRNFSNLDSIYALLKKYGVDTTKK